MNRKIVIDFDQRKIAINKIEKNLINYWIDIKYKGCYKIPYVIPISEKIHLDFIGWDNPEFFDVLICHNKKGFLKNRKGKRYV